jgi:hypothetical protein
MSKPSTYQATQADWDLQKAWRDECQDARCLLELRARVEALEVDANEDSASTHFCFDSIIKRLEALEKGATCPHVVTSDEGTSYCGLAEQVARIGQSDVPVNTSVQASQPTSNDRQIRSSLVEQVAAAIADDGCAVDVWHDISRAAIYEVAAWMREQQNGDLIAATMLEREAR